MNIRKKQENDIMIFLYFFIACVIIVGIYFAVEYSVKYFDDKKSNKTIENLPDNKSIYAKLIAPHSVLDLNSFEETPISENVTIATQEYLNREELIVRLQKVLNFVKSEKELQQMKIICERFLKASKNKNNHLLTQKKLRHQIYCFYLLDNETQDFNSRFSNLDMNVRIIENCINAYSDNLMDEYCKINRKGVKLSGMRYAIVSAPKQTNPK